MPTGSPRSPSVEILSGPYEFTSNTRTVRLRRLHDTQRRICSESRRFNVVALGRRAGKTVLGQDRAVHPALAGHPVGWFSPTYKLLSDVWRELANTLGGVTTTRSVQEHRLELLTGGTVEFWSLDDPDPARGRRYKRVIIDEAAMAKNLRDAWSMAIRPTLTDLEGDAWFLSTPKGMNYFWTLFQMGQDELEPDWMSWQMPTSVNPYISLAEIERARTDPSMTERTYGQEYLAEFLPDGTGVFRNIEAACVLEPQDVQAGHHYAMGVDWGKHQDFTVLSVLDACCRRQVAIDRFNRIDYAFQVQRLDTLAQRYRPSVMVVEKNSMGEPLIEDLARKGYPVWPFTTTNASKAEAIEALSLALEREWLKLLSDDTQKGELLAYDAERLPGGLLRYGALEGFHDDCVMSLALAWQAIAHAAPQSTRLRFG
jgi:Terminase RNaseH-like domain